MKFSGLFPTKVLNRLSLCFFIMLYLTMKFLRMRAIGLVANTSQEISAPALKIEV